MHGQFFKDCSRHFETPLCRLIGISRRANCDPLATLDLLQLGTKQRRSMLFDKNLAFELHTVAQFHKFVRIACVTVLAGKLATSVRIDCPGEREIACAYDAAKKRTCLECKVFDIMAFAQRLSRGGDSLYADQFRRVGAFAE